MTKENEAYLVLQEASGIKEGDLVKVTRRAKDYEMGWNDVWEHKINGAMDMSIGQDLKVMKVYNNSASGMQLRNGHFYPFFVLEKVASAKPSDPIIDFIEKSDFGCQKESVKELVKMILKRMEEKDV